jgi:DNA-directed RNA polymerase specialized sigma24 family protein
VSASRPAALVERLDHHHDAATESYEEFVAAHAEQFCRYLQRVLGRGAEDRGGRVAVEDTLQDALLALYQRWPELDGLEAGERSRRLYRWLRDAAVRALRAEYGERSQRTPRPRIIAYDFGSLEQGGDEQPVAERELTAAVLGTMVRDVAEDSHDTRTVLSRGMLVAGLRALSEDEAVVLIAVDHLGWDQHRLSEQLGMSYDVLRRHLFLARKIFYALVRHATGVEVDEEERARLAAYRAGELVGAERRAMSRHLKHCARCQALDAERAIFGGKAVAVLAPLPYLAGARILAHRGAGKAAAGAGGAGAVGAGLFAQAGAAKALAVVMGVIGLGGAVTATLAALTEHSDHRRPATTVSATDRHVVVVAPGGMGRVPVPVASSTHARRHRHRAPARHHARAKHEHVAAQAPSEPSTTTSSPPPAQPAPQTTTKPSASASAPSGQSCEFFCG